MTGGGITAGLSRAMKQRHRAGWASVNECIPLQIQALDRNQPGLPLKKGRSGTMTHDYKRNRTTALFAALNTLDGRVIGQGLPRHRGRPCGVLAAHH